VGLEGENRLRGEPERNEIDAFGNFVFVLGGSLFGGEKGQRPSAPHLRRVCGDEALACAKDRHPQGRDGLPGSGLA
jgi:hypothetical protein